MKKNVCSPGGNYVLDSFALLAFLQGEPAAPQIRKVLEYGASHRDSVWLSVVNLSECLYIVERRKGAETARRVLEALQECPIRIEAATDRHAVIAARIKAQHRVSLADAYAAALALDKMATVVTGDPEFKALEKKIPVLWIPQSVR